MRRVVLVAVAGACLAIPSAAHPQGASATASGTMLAVSNELQIVSLTNGDGTVTKCGVLSGTLRTETRDINFGAGGPLSPEGTLDPSTQALVDTIREGSQLGTAAVTTITYEEVGTLCGHSGTVVTGASLRVLPTPTPTPTATPPTSQPTPKPNTRTVSGVVTRMSAFGQMIIGASSTCEMWPGILKTDAGPSLLFAVETPMTGSLDTGLNPTDPAALKRAKLLQQARFFGTRAPVTMTYMGPVRACTYPLEAVVTAATVAFPSPYDTRPKVTRRGRVTRMSRPSVVSGNGATCDIWRGSLKTTDGVAVSFSVEARLTGSPAHAADRRAARTARTLRRALAEGRTAVTTITFAGPVIACGKELDHAVTRASIARRPVGHA